MADSFSSLPSSIVNPLESTFSSLQSEFTATTPTANTVTTPTAYTTVIETVILALASPSLTTITTERLRTITDPAEYASLTSNTAVTSNSTSEKPEATRDGTPERNTANALSTGAKAGVGIVSGLVFLLSICALLFIWRRRSRRRSQKPEPQDRFEKAELHTHELPRTHGRAELEGSYQNLSANVMVREERQSSSGEAQNELLSRDRTQLAGSSTVIPSDQSNWHDGAELGGATRTS